MGRRVWRGAESVGDFVLTSSRLAVPRLPRANGLSRSLKPFMFFLPDAAAIEVTLFFIS